MLEVLDLFVDSLFAAAKPPVSKIWLLTFLDGQVSSTFSSLVLPAVGPGKVLDFSSCVSVGFLGWGYNVQYGLLLGKVLTRS